LGSIIPGASITDLELPKSDDMHDIKPDVKAEEDDEDEDMPDASMIGKGKGKGRMTKVG
jgi:hypothetical protein